MLATVILIVALLIDGISNIFLLIYSPRWDNTKRKCIKTLEEQNRELREFIKAIKRD